MSMTKRILIAQIAGPHGVKGLAKLNFYGENISLFDDPVYVGETGDKCLNISIKSQMKKQFLIEIEEVSDRNAVETLKGQKLYIDRELLDDTEEDEIYHVDMIGLKAVTKDREEVGEIISVQNFGASDLLEIKPNRKPSFYLPFTEQCVLEIKEKEVIVELPEYI